MDRDHVRAGGFRLRRDKSGSLSYRDTTFTARIAPDGTLSFADRPNIRYQGLGFGFDLTDALLRAQGEDPYRFEKVRFARATAALRLRLARRHKRRILRQSIPALRRLLRRKLRRLPRRRRALRRLRRLLFAWWDECDEARGPRDMRLVARYGERARALIVEAIRCHLRQGTPGEYSPQELSSLSRRRRSRQRFAPYARDARRCRPAGP